MNPILETSRLYLRRFTLADAPLILELNTPNVLKYVHERLPEGLEDAKQIIENIILPQYQLYGLGRWAAFTKEEHKFIGWCGLKYLADKEEIDLGYRFIESEWGKGYATETARACVAYGFMKKNLSEIIGRAHIENIASQIVLQKAGLQYQEDKIEDDVPLKIYKLGKEDYLLLTPKK